MIAFQRLPLFLFAYHIFLTQGICLAQEKSATVQLDPKTNLQLIYVPAGAFDQGSPEHETGRKSDESQRHIVLTSGFLIGKFPVTIGEYKVFVAATGYKTEAERGKSGGFGFDGKELAQRPEFNWKNPGFPATDEHPVCLVTIDDANAFLAWLNQKTSRKFFLPTEAQWEYACRAGTATRFSNGDSVSDLDKLGWYRENSGNGTRPVGKKTPNAFGIHDMSGNVFEWCNDTYATYRPGNSVDPLQLEPDKGDKVRKVLRGGSWLRPADNCRSAARYRNDSRSRNADNGFRVCCLLSSELNADSFKDLDAQTIENAPKPKR